LLRCESNAFPNDRSKRKIAINVSRIRSMFIKKKISSRRSFVFCSHQMVSKKSMDLINWENRWLSFEGIEPSEC
jgi:hypothetical protein